MDDAKNALSQDTWAEANANPSITTEVLDGMITEMKKARDIYESAKTVSTNLYKEFETLEGKVIEALTQAGKRKYHVDGIGLCYFIEKLVVTTPKTIESKKLFFDYLQKQYGDTFLLDKQGINHQTLQKIYNDCYKEAVEAGVGEQFQIPGLDQPTAQISLGFRKEK